MPSELFRVVMRSAISATAFVIVAGSLSVGFAALTSGLSLSDKANTGSWLSSASWNRIVDSIVELDARTSPISVSSGNVGVGVPTPAAKLDIGGQIIRAIPHATANGPIDTLDDGQIVSRVLNFTKLRNDTAVRISYTDALRVYGTNKACRWELRVNGVSCPTQPLVYDYYTIGDDTHRSRTVVGYCGGVSSGAKQIQVWVSSTPWYAGSDCYTGWNNSTWVLEAEEAY